MILLKTAIASATLIVGGVFFPAPASAAAPACEAYVLAQWNDPYCNAYSGEEDQDCADVGGPVRLTGTADPWRLDGDNDGWGCEEEDSGTGGAAPQETPATAQPTPTAVGVEPVADDVQAEAQLPDTGMTGVWTLGALGLSLVTAGGIGLAVRRRRIRFES